MITEKQGWQQPPVGVDGIRRPQSEDEKRERECNPVCEFLWRCAGADVDILRKCPGSQSRYTGVGSTIVFTAVMAWASCGYALYYVFDNYALAAFFGLLWALMIFCLDRFIVNSIPGSLSLNKRLLFGSPRLVMAIIIGVVISAPIEMKIFEKEISVKVLEQGKKDVDRFASVEMREADYAFQEKNNAESYKYKVDSILRERHNGNFSPGVQPQINEQEEICKDAQLKIGGYTKELDGLQKELEHHNRKFENISDEIKGIESRTDLNDYAKKLRIADKESERSRIDNVRKQINSKIRTAKSSKKAAEENRKNAQDQIENLKSNDKAMAATAVADASKVLATKDSAYMAKDVAKAAERRRYADVADVAANGIATRLKALHSIVRDDFESGSAVVMIALLFILIEVAPTLLKIFLPSGAYEKMHEALEYKAVAASERMISEINIEVNNAVKEAIQAADARLSTSKRMNDELFDSLATAQAEVVREAIRTWKGREMERAKEHPEEFLEKHGVRPGLNKSGVGKTQ